MIKPGDVVEVPGSERQEGWMFTLENGDEILIESSRTAEEVVEQMQDLYASQYIWDDNHIISVRRVVRAVRVVETIIANKVSDGEDVDG